MRPYRTLVTFRLKAPVDTGGGWSKTTYNEVQAWCDVIASEVSISSLGDKLTETKTMTLRTRYNPQLFYADTAIMPDAVEYRVLSRVNVAELGNEMELTISNVD